MTTFDPSTLTFVIGAGNPAKGTACIMSAAVAKLRVSRGEPLGEATDVLDCACPVVRRLAIARNDLPMDGELRKQWALPMIDRIIGSRRDDETTRRRAEAVARYAVTVIAAEALRAAGMTDQADRLASLPPTATMGEMRDAADAADAAADADASAYVAAAAYAAAAAAAYAADAAAAYAAAADAAYAAYAALAADAAAAAIENAAYLPRTRHLDAMIDLALSIDAAEAEANQ
jgi:hypothetical protein